MKTIRAIASALFLAGLATSVEAVLVQGPGPFVQRADVASFQKMERSCHSAYSASSDLVIYATRDGHVLSVLSLVEESSDYTLKFVRTSEDRAQERDEPAVRTVPAAIGRRVVDSLRSMLEYGVFAPTDSQDDPVSSPFGSNRWIYLRISPREAIAGLVTGYTMHNPSGQRAQAFQSIVGRLEDLCRAEDYDQNAILTDLDVIAGVFLLEEKTHSSK